jgi:hypothetical protein
MNPFSCLGRTLVVRKASSFPGHVNALHTALLAARRVAQSPMSRVPTSLVVTGL